MPILPDFTAATFVPGAPIDNRYFPLHPGAVHSFGGSKLDEDSGEIERERNDFFVTFENKTIEGVQTVVVRDTAYANGILVEDTLDWHAQDADGNVWYFGEIAYNYEYDDDGNYVETNNDGSWTAGVDGAQAGWIMRAEPGFGASYYQEFYPGVAVDEAIVVGVNQQVEIELGDFDKVLKTLETTALEPDVAEFKNYALDVGLVLVEEELDEEGEPELEIELLGMRHVGQAGQGPVPSDLVDWKALPAFHDAEDPEAEDFEGNGTSFFVTLVHEASKLDNAIGAYTIDNATGELGEGRILFESTDETEIGDAIAIEVEQGQILGLFLVANAGELGIDLSAFADGGLFFRNILTDDPATTGDGLAPLVTSADGTALPIQALHALGNQDGFNFLNPVAGMQALELEPDRELTAGEDEVTVLAFEDLLATNRAFGSDFDDALIAVSRAPLSQDALDDLLDGLDASVHVRDGGVGEDRLHGSCNADRLLGFDGDDRLNGYRGDDQLFGGEGDDCLRGGKGDDILNGGEGDDLLEGGWGADQFVFEDDHGDDRIKDFRLQQGDKIVLGAELGFSSAEEVAAQTSAGPGNSTLLNTGSGTIEIMGIPEQVFDMNINAIVSYTGELF